jgi:hypothetical protein
VKMPFLKFYPRDWVGDIELRFLSHGARGLWIDMLCLMAMNERRGYLEAAGKPVADSNSLARLTSGCPEEVARLLDELETGGVFSRDDAGVIYSRRMVRDAEVSRIKQEAGKQGGNPALHRQKDKQADKPVVKPRNQKPETRNQISQELGKQALEVYDTYPKKVAKPKALQAISKAIGEHGYDHILERTQLFAKTCNRPMQFVPDPANFFNNEQFNDDPDTWRDGDGDQDAELQAQIENHPGRFVSATPEEKAALAELMKQSGEKGSL